MTDPIGRDSPRLSELEESAEVVYSTYRTLVNDSRFRGRSNNIAIKGALLEAAGIIMGNEDLLIEYLKIYDALQEKLEHSLPRQSLIRASANALSRRIY